ncbi:MAG: glycerol kinase [Marinilabiliales bacterium]|nr:MAG: glycerol kinase [Marinilabiliales bacterium]
MEKSYILSLDQGTTSSRAIIYNHKGEVCAMAQKEYPQLFPKPNWVEHNPSDILSSQFSVATEVITKYGISPENIVATGITNQRETTIVWERKTGKPVYNAIVWQDHRTSDYCNKLIENGLAEMVKEKTGLEIDSYFSATKIRWILENVPGARAKANKGDLLFGTVDTWLIYNLSGGKMHVTDVTNASRTMLFNISSLNWDEDLLKLFDIPKSMLPEVKMNDEVLALTAGKILNTQIPIAAVAGDQQAAMFGQMCVEKGMAKNTYGTGCFLMVNTGEEFVKSNHKMLGTIAWNISGKTTYALEGSVFVGGAVIQWLRDGLEIFKKTKDVETLVLESDDNGGVYFVPAFTGLGAPYWKQDAKGLIYGINRGTTKSQIARAALESIAFQSYDVLSAMEKDIGVKINKLRVDGGASANNTLMQFQSDILNTEVQRPQILETTSLGVAYMAGLNVGFWNDIQEVKNKWQLSKQFIPNMKNNKRELLLSDWKNAVKRSF